MMQLIFRDDDTSFFTTPALLEKVYTPVWEHGIPVCLAVIPAHSGKIVVSGENGDFIDPNIHPDYRGQDKNFPISDNPELCAYLNDKIRQGLVEICLHGYNHQWREFGTTDAGVIRQKLDDGLALLRRTFPAAEVKTLLVPYDIISHPALDIVLDYGLHTSLSIYSIPSTSPLKLSAPTPNRIYTQNNGIKFFTMGDWDMVDYTRSTTQWMALLEDEATTLVCLNHYYMFYQDFGAENAALFETWRSLIAQVLPKYAANVTTFNRAVS